MDVRTERDQSVVREEEGWHTASTYRTYKKHIRILCRENVNKVRRGSRDAVVGLCLESHLLDVRFLRLSDWFYRLLLRLLCGWGSPAPHPVLPSQPLDRERIEFNTELIRDSDVIIVCGKFKRAIIILDVRAENTEFNRGFTLAKTSLVTLIYPWALSTHAYSNSHSYFTTIFPSSVSENEVCKCW